MRWKIAIIISLDRIEFSELFGRRDGRCMSKKCDMQIDMSVWGLKWWYFSDINAHTPLPWINKNQIFHMSRRKAENATSFSAFLFPPLILFSVLQIHLIKHQAEITFNININTWINRKWIILLYMSVVECNKKRICCVIEI